MNYVENTAADKNAFDVILIKHKMILNKRN